MTLAIDDDVFMDMVGPLRGELRRLAEMYVTSAYDQLVQNDQYQRFSVPGALFGNLFLTALTGITGDFHQAILTAESVLSVRGKIFPATLTDVRLRGRGVSGRVRSLVAVERRGRFPLIRLGIFRVRSVTVGNLTEIIKDQWGKPRHDRRCCGDRHRVVHAARPSPV